MTAQAAGDAGEMGDAYAPSLPDYTALRFPDLSADRADRPWLLINMIASLDGKTVIEGTEQGLGSESDRRLMRELRFHADVVVGGAQTLRTSGNSSRLPEDLQRRRVAAGRSANPIAAVLTASGDLPTDRTFFTADDFRAVVYVADDAPAANLARLRATGREVVPVPAATAPAAMLRHMHAALGARLVLSEGGASLNGACIEQGLADEMFLTVAPVVVAGPDGLTAVRSPRLPSRDGVIRPRLVSAHPNPATGEVYLRYRFTDPGALGEGAPSSSAPSSGAASPGEPSPDASPPRTSGR